MKKINKIVLLALAISILSLVGCSGDNASKVENGVDINTESQTSNPTNENTGPDDVLSLTLSESFSLENDRIWYITDSDDDDYGKDLEIEKILVIKDGVANLFQEFSEKITFGDIANLSDDEVIAFVVSENSEYNNWVDEEKNKYITANESILEFPTFDDPYKITDEIYFDEDFAEVNITENLDLITTNLSLYKQSLTSYIDYLSEYEYDPSVIEFASGIVTDSTGNNVKRETLKLTINNKPRFHSIHYNGLSTDTILSDISFVDMITEIAQEDLYYANEIHYYSLIEIFTYGEYDDLGMNDIYMGTYDFYLFFTDDITDVMTVYDAQFDGYKGEYSDAYTRVEGEVNFVFDEIGTEGVEIDPEWAE